MWINLKKEDRDEYQKMILGFASLTEMFAQKSDGKEDDIPSPIINSKYQETVFQKVFKAYAEDIGNTSYDASLLTKNNDGSDTKYLVGIKTFGYASGFQKIAQFKACHDEWSEILNIIKNNATSKNKDEINTMNHKYYMELAKKIANLRNIRIESSESNLQGFRLDSSDKIKTVYHVLMPSPKNCSPTIYVGETDYNKINIDKIKIIGCTKASNPTNFDFTDGNHIYRFTAADSQLLMSFDNKNIVLESWPVHYADDAYSLFKHLGEQIVEKNIAVKDSVSWMITDKNGEMELFSGFNGFYGVGSKFGHEKLLKKAETMLIAIQNDFSEFMEEFQMKLLVKTSYKYFRLKPNNFEERVKKANIRKEIMNILKEINNDILSEKMKKLLFRPSNEMYIPIPKAKRFHIEHPDFFGIGYGQLDDNNHLAIKDKNCRAFTLVFEPSGDEIKSFIAQDFGKAIESFGKQTYLGEWILRKVFQLNEYEPLTRKRLLEVGINGIRLTKESDNKIHLSFIWIDSQKLPDDYFE